MGDNRSYRDGDQAGASGTLDRETLADGTLDPSRTADEVQELARVYDPVDGLYARHAELIDKRLVASLSVGEASELRELEATLDRLEEPHFSRVKRRLLDLESRLAPSR